MSNYEPQINEIFIFIDPLVEEASIARYRKKLVGGITLEFAKNNRELAEDAYRTAWDIEMEELGIPWPYMARPKPMSFYPCPPELARRAKW